MSVNELLTAMFPGDPDRKIPGFAAMGIDAGAFGHPKLMQAMGNVLSEMPDIETIGVNGFLSMLRKHHPELAETFIDAALTTYFTAPEVIRCLLAGNDTLFPHAKALPEIDYTLLESVVERRLEGSR